MPTLVDESTGAYSWEAFTDFAGLIIAQTRRRSGSLGILLLRLDIVASRESSPEQDESHAQVLASALLRTVRGGDMVARAGPSSFAVLAQDAQQAGARRLGERIQEALSGAGAEASLTASAGVAIQPQDGVALPDLLRRAEDALDEAVAAGGHQVVLSGAGAIAAPVEPELQSASTPEPATISAILGLAAERREALAQATAAFERGEIEGISIATQPGACPVCLDAARDVYVPRLVPPLPLVGCTGPTGCRCTYDMPPIDPRRAPPPLPVQQYGDLKIPVRLQAAALFGSDPKRSTHPRDLAEYLDHFPLLPIQADIQLAPGEQPYLARPASRAWERLTPTSSAIHGPLFPLGGSLSLWLRRAGKPPTLPSDITLLRDEGTFYLTNWRIIFSKRGSVDSFLVMDIAGVEYMRDAIACRIGERQTRLLFWIRDALQVGLCISRSIRDAVAPSA